MSTKKTSGSDLRVARRDLFKGAALLVGSAPLAAGCSSDDAAGTPSGPLPAASVFVHGVASGDPLPDSVILWTRVTSASAPTDVEWEIAEDPEMQKRVTGGVFKTDADRDYTVKVDARGLAAGRTYYYRFRALGATSPVGRTRTAPSGPTENVRFAVCSCASFAHGYFHAYRALAERSDLDAVIHLGDYIYEYASGQYGEVREYEPTNEITTLADYRARHAMYKRDPDLRAVHQQHPFIPIWDDHEVANDAYKDGAQNHSEGAEGAWADRKAAGLRAYREWMPMREQEGGKIFRKVSYGDLVDLIMLDTRHYARTKQAGGLLGEVPSPDPSRSLLGDEQASWFEESIRTSTAKWKLVGQQVMVGNLTLSSGQVVNLDQWHGYPESRKRLLDFLRDFPTKNVVILTGDIHSSWANDLIYDPLDTAAYDVTTGRGSVGVELVAPAISSPGIPDQFMPFLNSARPNNPQVRWYDATRRGFLIVDVNAERTQGAWFLLPDVVPKEPQTPTFASAWAVRAGQSTLVQENAPAPDRPNPPAPAPKE